MTRLKAEEESVGEIIALYYFSTNMQHVSVSKLFTLYSTLYHGYTPLESGGQTTEVSRAPRIILLVFGNFTKMSETRFVATEPSRAS